MYIVRHTVICIEERKIIVGIEFANDKIIDEAQPVQGRGRTQPQEAVRVYAWIIFIRSTKVSPCASARFSIGDMYLRSLDVLRSTSARGLGSVWRLM